jgi:RimJ/RimL family protein N-acetyltransferase
MILGKEDYGKARELITSRNELSVFSVLDGLMPGEVLADSAENPQSVMIESSETKLLAGSADNEDFNAAVAESLDFWDLVTPDSEAWREKIPGAHPNRFIREYTRHRYTLTRDDFIPANLSLPEGYVLERIDLQALRSHDYVNADKIYDWTAAWGSDEHFAAAGCGCYIRHQDTIVSWSVSDCYAGDRIAIGIHTASGYRKQGLAGQVASATVQCCLDKGYNIVEWLCVSTNSGSQATAKRVGFKLENTYLSFTPYPPIENLTDLDEDGWYEWGAYLEQPAQEEPRLYWNCLNSYVKANAVEKAMRVIGEMTRTGNTSGLEHLTGAIAYYQREGLCSAFNSPEWEDFAKRMID